MASKSHALFQTLWNSLHPISLGRAFQNLNPNYQRSQNLIPVNLARRAKLMLQALIHANEFTCTHSPIPNSAGSSSPLTKSLGEHSKIQILTTRELKTDPHKPRPVLSSMLKALIHINEFPSTHFQSLIPQAQIPCLQPSPWESIPEPGLKRSSLSNPEHRRGKITPSNNTKSIKYLFYHQATQKSGSLGTLPKQA